jgi:large subunit ribosomal protein L4
MYRGAMRAILSELARRERMIVVEELALDQPKTRLLSAKLKEFGVADTLLVTEEVNPNLHLAARNIPNVQVVDASSIDPLSLLKYDATIITVPAVKRLEAWLG